MDSGRTARPTLGAEPDEMVRLDQREIDRAWHGFRSRLRRRGMIALLERNGEDHFGQALLELSEAMASGLPIRNPAGWLITCAWRRTQNQLDQERRRPRSVSADDLPSLTSDAPTPEQSILAAADRRALVGAIRCLSHDDRTLIKLVYGAGLSRREAARRIGWSYSKLDRRHGAALDRVYAFLMNPARPQRPADPAVDPPSTAPPRS